VKPSCGFCTDLGIECTYRKPTVGDRYVDVISLYFILLVVVVIFVDFEAEQKSLDRRPMPLLILNAAYHSWNHSWSRQPR
jgi:hypothetical protein